MKKSELKRRLNEIASDQGERSVDRETHRLNRLIRLQIELLHEFNTSAFWLTGAMLFLTGVIACLTWKLIA